MTTKIATSGDQVSANGHAASADDQNNSLEGNLAQLQDMDVEATIELGRTRITLDQALELGDQSIIELDKLVGEPVDVRLNGKLFAHGEVVTVAESFGVRLTEIIHRENA